MDSNSKIFIAGHKGMVGSALVRALTVRGHRNIVTVSRKDLDLRDQKNVQEFFASEVPDVVFLAAAKVGGILANSSYPAEFSYDNLMIQNNVIHNAHLYGARKLVFMGSSCIYPRECPQPIREEYLLCGVLEPTNEAYAIAKIAGIKMAGFYRTQYGLDVICPVPCNLYGVNDSFDPDNSHVLSALVKKFVDAVDENKKSVVLWGSGSPIREFMHVDDMAKAVLMLVDVWNTHEIINVGSGETISIRSLAGIVAEKAGYGGEIAWDTTKPDGMPRKCLDASIMKSLGFQAEIDIRSGIEGVVAEYRELKRHAKK